MTGPVSQNAGKLSREEKAALWSGRDFWRTKDFPEKGIPGMRVSDGPHGLRMLKDQSHLWDRGTGKSVCYPTASLMASTFNRELIGRIGHVLGLEARSIGVHIILGPGMNLKRTPLCGRNFEYYSEDPYLSAEMAIAFVKGVQGTGVGACIKHFACNNQEYERMSTSAQIDSRTLHELYLYHFERAVKEAEPWAVMCAYNKINGTFCSENHGLLKDILKNEWGFQGIVISDWTAVVDPVNSMLAGVDLEMPGTGGVSEVLLLKALKDEKIPAYVLDETNKRLLSTLDKIALQIELNEKFIKQEAIDLACEAAAEGIVLLKNDYKVLPINPSKHKTVAVIGEFAKAPRFQGGGSSHVQALAIESAWDNLRILCPDISFAFSEGYSLEDTENEEYIDDAVELAGKSDLAIVFAGLPASYEEEGYDRKNMDLPPVHNRLIKDISAVQENTVVVLIGGSAVLVEDFADDVPTIVMNWLAGQGGGKALAKILCGEINPSGKLSETFPLNYMDNPSALNYPGEDRTVIYGEKQFIGYRHYDKRNLPVRFAFGHGLSYTEFEYS